MNIKHIGIITGGSRTQASINIHHAESIGESLKKDFKITYYDLSIEKDIERMLANKKAGKLDFIVNNAAGKEGGDGTVEGLLTILQVPFLGSDTLATAVAFDKKTTKRLAADAGIPIIQGITVLLEDFRENPERVVAEIEKVVGYPLVVKASKGSDQIGASLVKSPNRIVAALKSAFKEDEEVIVEKFIRRAAEVTCLVIGNGKTAEALDPAEFLYEAEFPYVGETFENAMYKAKPEVLQAVKRFSYLAHLAVGCSDYSRSDFIVDKHHQIHYLETNAHAGLWNGSIVSFIAKRCKDWDYDQMLRELIDLATLRYESRN